ncbi:helix-turn-helix transcriptional regulator [Ideonella sp.]|uniref:helix-turn-helix transcriptional regulator n=1 Tax=Ideonella sp. TaxID=1929293 RepID=UPI0037C0CD4C
MFESAAEAISYVGPERRTRGNDLWQLLAAVLDEVDYGLMLVADGGRVIHANHFARQMLEGGVWLEIRAGKLKALNPKYQVQLLDAIVAAQHKDARTMLNMGVEGAAASGLSVVPLPIAVDSDTHTQRPVLITLQRSQLVEALSVGAFARAHNLSRREEEVLGCLCAGMKPAAIAQQLRISEGTIRTHVHNLKLKAHCSSMVELVKRVAVLPPIMTALKAGPLVSQ